MKHLAVLLIATVTLGCGGGSSSPTSPSAQPPSGPFNGTWSGTYGAFAVPMTLTLTQNGSTVTGTSVITCSGCGDGRSNVMGTASGNVASVAFTHLGETTPFLQGITLTINGASMTIEWRLRDGAAVTGTLMSGSPPATAAPGPTPTSRDGVWNLRVEIGSCYRFTHTVPITISGGAYSGNLFAYCATARDGVTRLDTGSGCGSDLRTAVSIAGRMSSGGIHGSVEGNLTLAGGACNGSNGFFGNMSSPTTGRAASNWGTLIFSR